MQLCKQLLISQDLQRNPIRQKQTAMTRWLYPHMDKLKRIIAGFFVHLGCALKRTERFHDVDSRTIRFCRMAVI